MSRHTQQMGHNIGPAGYWQSVPNSRAASPGNDNGSETSSVMPAPVPGLAASRVAKDKYNHLSYWKARKVRKLISKHKGKKVGTKRYKYVIVPQCYITADKYRTIPK